MLDQTLDTIAPVNEQEVQEEAQAIEKATKRDALSAWDKYYLSMRQWARILETMKADNMSVRDELSIDSTIL
jgi:hypothetical protein